MKIIKNCGTCRHKDVSLHLDPCKSCGRKLAIVNDNWEPEEECSKCGYHEGECECYD